MCHRKHPSKVKLCALLTFLLLCSQAYASTPPPFLVQESQHSNRITIYSEHLADPNGELQLDDLLSGEFDDAFLPTTHARERLSYDSNVWWIRIALENKSETSLARILEFSPGHFSRLTIFKPDKNGYTIQHSGSNLSPPWADIPDRRQLYQITLPPRKTETYYFRAEPSGSMNFTIYLSTLAAQIENNATNDIVYLIVGGLLLGLILFNGGQYCLSKNITQLYYLLMLAALLLASFAAAGFLGIRFLAVEGLQLRLEVISVLAGIGLSLMFARRFLQIRDFSPQLDMLLKALVFITVIVALISFSLPTVTAAALTYTTATLLIIPIIYAGIHALRAQVEHAKLYLMARGGLCCTALIIFLNTFDVLSINVELPLVILMAITAEGFLFTFTMLRQQTTALQRHFHTRQKQVLEEAIWQTRSETLARVSHEIRTPMSGVLGMAELLRDTPLTPNQKECVRSIRSAGENLLKIINDVLEYSRLEQGGTDVNREPFDLSDLVMDALELFRERAEEKQIELIAHIHTNVPVAVEGDHSRLRQVLTNLLGACIKHTNHGELVLDVSRDPSGLANHLRFELEGSVMKQLTHQLDPFCSDEDGVSDTDSTTLGLAIAHQLVLAMHGKCGLSESRHHNLVCWLNLPLPASAAQDELELPVDAVMLAGHSMLVVDDSSTVTRVIRQQALSWGMRVTICHDPREALATIRTQANLNEPFNIVLLDHQMPGMSGMQLATRIHEDLVISHPLILVMLTGVRDAPTAITARNVGIHQVLTKPVSGQRLKRALAEALGMLTQHKKQTPNIMPRESLRVLVAEDHLLSQKVIRGMLGKLGLTPDIVGNGRDAVNAVREGNYDIVLMDCEMPEMDGFEATRTIREWENREQRQPIPIIALTAHILREHRERSMASGMNAHVPKPIEIGALSEVIVRLTTPVTQSSPPASSGTPT